MRIKFQSSKQTILPFDQIPTHFKPLMVVDSGSVGHLPGLGRKLEELREDPAFADEPTVLLSRNAAVVTEFTDWAFLSLWLWVYPDVAIPMGAEREKFRAHLHVAAYLKARQEGFNLYADPLS